MSKDTEVAKSDPRIPMAIAMPRANQMAALGGSLDERIRAFDQIAANLATLQLNGWDSVQKVKAGCWLADGAGMHPAVFMQNHHSMLIKGKLVIEPKWEFVLGVLQSRVPGFKLEVLIETDDCAKVCMSDGSGNSQTVEYTLADAKRQGLMGSGNAWTSGSTREMCMKQAIKRCGRRLSSAALMDLPVGLEAYELADPGAGVDAGAGASKAISEAVALEDDEPVAVAGGGPALAGSSAGKVEEPTDRGPQPSPASTGVKNSVVALSVRLVKLYGKQPKAVLLEKASLIYNEMTKEATGTDPQMEFRRADQIGPSEAQRMIDWIAARKGRAPATPAPGGTDAPPAPEEAAWTPPPEEPLPAGQVARDAADDYDDFALVVKRAKGIFGRKFIVESPAGSGKFWFVDQTTFSQIGKTTSMKLMEGGEVMADRGELQQLARILAADCDAAERGRS